MKHPFTELKPEYERLLATMIVHTERLAEIDTVARKLVDDRHMPLYQREAAATGVPAVLLAALDERESGADPSRAIGQGDRWNEVSTHVPKGMGPFPSKVEADIFYIAYDHLNDISASAWTWAYTCWKGEAWNGFGPRNHGIHTGYLWAATNHYLRGKYVADGKWDAAFVDRQIGIVPVMKRLVELRPDLAFTTESPFKQEVAEVVPSPQPAPDGLNGETHNVEWVQASLNKVLRLDPPLAIDGSYGRMTTNAVKRFQATHPPMVVDGLYGPLTESALTEALSRMA